MKMARSIARAKVDPERIPAKNGGRLSKLTENQIDELVISYNAGKTQKELGEQYGISVSTVRRYLKSRE